MDKSYNVTVCIDGILPSCVDVQSEDLCLLYAGTPDYCGLQSNFEDGSPEYQRQMQLCHTMADCMRELVEIHEKNRKDIDDEKEL
jgi:hypothetical protein